MPGVRGPQPPASGPPANSRTRRRNSLPALSSDQLNRLSANASKKTNQVGKTAVNKSSQEESSKKTVNNVNGKPKGSSVDQTKPLKPVGKVVVSKDSHASLDRNGNECNGKDDFSSFGTKYSNDISPVGSGSSILQKKTQSKTNAVFIFHFEEDDDKPKETKSSDDNSPLIESSNFKTELSNTWPKESFDVNSFNLTNSVRFNTLSFCGHKHKQFRDSRKFCHIMSPVLEMKTPLDDTEYDLEDEWSTSSCTDHWMDTRSSNGTSSPGIFQGRDDVKRRARPLQINANSNQFLQSEPDTDLSGSLRSALSLSPRRNSRPDSRKTLTSLRTTNSKPKSSQPSSSQRLRSDKGGGIASTVGHIFNSLRPTPISTSKSHDDSDSMSRTQLPPRLQARRRSLSALPDLVRMKGATAGLVKR